MTFISLSDGTRLRCTTRGSTGPFVVLVHGWKQSHRLFDQTVQRLAPNHRVIAFDQRGTGESDKPDSSYDFELLAADLIEVMEQHAVEDATLVGWSMGCTTVLSCMARQPSRVGRVVLLNGPIRLSRTTDFDLALPQDQLIAYIDGLEADWPREQQDFLADSLLPENRSITPLLEFAAWQTPLDIALRLVRNQSLIDHRSTIERLTVPVLAAYSDRDPYWPVGLGDWIARQAPHGRLHVFRNSAHCAPLEEPEEFARVLVDFTREGDS